MKYGPENYLGYQHCSTLGGQNNAANLEGLDDDVQVELGVKAAEGEEKARQKGICCGITTSWMIAVLSGVAEATDIFRFGSYFHILRFQGAYMKAAQGTAKGNLADAFLAKLYLARMPVKCRLKDSATEVKDVLNGSIFPRPGSTWACYGGLYGHAIGMAESDGKFYLMDPNYGLFAYRSREDMLTALQRVIKARLKKMEKTTAPDLKPGKKKKAARPDKPTTGMLFLYVST